MTRNWIRKCFSLLAFVVATQPLWAQAPITAGSRLFYTQKGQLPRSGSLNFAYTGAVFRDPSGYSNGVGNAALAQTSNDFVLDYSINKNYMISIGANIFFTSPTTALVAPDFEPMKTNYVRRISLAIRTGSFGIFSDRVLIGGMFSTVIPASGEFNDPLIPVTATATSFGGDFIASYYFDKIFPLLSPGIHLNFGLHFNALEGQRTSKIGRVKNLNDAVSLRYALGADYPFNAFFSVFTELYGQFFLTGSQPNNLYGREGFGYAVIGTKIQVIENWYLELAGEFLFTDNKSTTVYDAAIGINRFTTDNISYAAYRGLFGIRYEFSRRKYIPNQADMVYAQEQPAPQPIAKTVVNTNLSPLQQREMEIKERVEKITKLDSLTNAYLIEENALKIAKAAHQQMQTSPGNQASQVAAVGTRIALAETALKETKKSLDELKQKDAKIRTELRRLYASGKTATKRVGSNLSEKLRSRLVLDVIDEQSEEIALLFKELQKYDNKLYGRLYYEITIGRNGNVERVRLLASSLDEALPISNFAETQISDKLRNWKFPPGKSEIIIDILKLELTPAGNLRISS